MSECTGGTNTLHTNPVTHQTLLSFRGPSVPVFEVTVATLPWSCIGEVEEHHGKTVTSWVPLFELTEKNELLRSRV